MARESTTPRSRKLATAFLGLGLAAATALAGCSTADAGDSGEASEVPFGASAEEYQAALADMSPVELVMQSGATSKDQDSYKMLEAFMDRVTEYSGGKITFDVTMANGLVSNVLEFDDALIDGRLDIAQFWPQYDPSEYPASNELLNVSVFRDPKLVTGWYGGQAAMQEIGLATPEVVEEWTSKGLIPLNIMSPDGPTIIACREPLTSLASLKGKQIRAGGTVHARQIEELGAIPVSLPYPEVYEALQRGILDCSMSAHQIATSAGHLEVAPYVLHTDVNSFASTPTNFYAGPKVKSLPKVAQQLILESSQLYEVRKIDVYMSGIYEDVSVDASIKQVQNNGGQWLAFDRDVEDKLAEINAGILADVEASSNFDGKELVARAKDVYAKWSEKVNELGYVDAGPISDLPNWFEGNMDFEDDPWFDAVVTEILAKYSPL